MCAGEYELFNTSDTAQILSESEVQGLVPGMKITMAFIIGRYQGPALDACPRPACRSRKFTKVSAGGQTCSACDVWFDVSRELLPRPFRLGVTEDVFKRIRADRKWFKNVRICPCPSDLSILLPIFDHQVSLVKTEGDPFLEETMIADAEKWHPHESLHHTMSFFGSASENSIRSESREAIATQAIRLISQETYLTVDELKDLILNDFEPGVLGLDSLMSLSIRWGLKDLGITIPNPHAGHMFYIEGPNFESFIKEFIKTWWYCATDT